MRKMKLGLTVLGVSLALALLAVLVPAPRMCACRDACVVPAVVLRTLLARDAPGPALSVGVDVAARCRVPVGEAALMGAVLQDFLGAPRLGPLVQPRLFDAPRGGAGLGLVPLLFRTLMEAGPVLPRLAKALGAVRGLQVLEVVARLLVPRSSRAAVWRELRIRHLCLRHLRLRRRHPWRLLRWQRVWRCRLPPFCFHHRRQVRLIPRVRTPANLPLVFVLFRATELR